MQVKPTEEKNNFEHTDARRRYNDNIAFKFHESLNEVPLKMVISKK